MHGLHDHGDDHHDGLQVHPLPQSPVVTEETSSAELASATTDVLPLDSLPLLSSRPGAAATLVLDFDGAAGGGAVEHSSNRPTARAHDG
ncbi:MAG: hypothetical protein KY433_03135 [Actinobacteria bacterium]|nr:hypothetical protein [Actinomycetota bacterium]